MVSLSLVLPLLFASSTQGFLWGGCCSYSPASYYVQPSGYYQPSVSYAYQPPTTYYMKVPIYAKISNLPSYPTPYAQPSTYAQPGGSYPSSYGGGSSSYSSVDMSHLYVQPGVDPNQLTNVVIYDRPTNNYVTAPRVQQTYQPPQQSYQVPQQGIAQPPQDSYDPFPRYDNKAVIKTETSNYSPVESTQQEEVYKIKNEQTGPYQPVAATEAPYQPAVVTEAPYHPAVVTEAPYQPAVAPSASYTPSSGASNAPGTNEPYKKKI
uniref:Cuticular protein n=1 Tax=Strongyloides venezuelensis TaxID=75913 RepID=A0A0K0FD92_STRVS